MTEKKSDPDKVVRKSQRDEEQVSSMEGKDVSMPESADRYADFSDALGEGGDHV